MSLGNDDADRLEGASASMSLDELLARRERNLLLGLRVAMPARIVAYEPATQKATVRGEFLPIKLVRGLEIPDLPIILQQIPVAWPRSGLGTSYMTQPLVPNDTGYVIFMDRAISKWLQVGNPAAPVDPISARAHDLADAVFIPGLHPDTDPIVPPTDLTGTTIESPLVKLGVGATEFALKGTALAALCNVAIPASIANVLAAVPVSSSPDPATNTAIAANKTAILAVCAAIVAAVSTKVQVGG